MLFSSISFIYFFLPVMLLTYYLTPRRHKNLTLFIGSLIFYFAGEPKYTLLLVFSTGVDYWHSRLIVKNRGKPLAKMALISSIVINLSMLMFFKYGDFIIINLNRLMGTNLDLLKMPLPIGISFFTFQTMSYTIDVYRGEADVQESAINLGAYVALFPQLIAGPIVRYKTISEELVNRTHSFHDFSYGIHRFMIGMAKKVLIANTLGELAQMIYTTQQSSVLYYWISAVAYALQIYYDFSGYSDMAIGLGRMFGFHFMENFNYPYVAKSITEFWQRWHISLGQWFRDYVYIPLGGNRVRNAIWLRNILIVWFLTGFWHGASWNFIFWGLFFGFMIVIEKFIGLKILKKLPSVLCHGYVIFWVILSFVVFRNDSIVEIVNYLKGMFGLLNIPVVSQESVYYLKSYWTTFVIGIIGATPFIKVTVQRLKKLDWSDRLIRGIEPFANVGLLLIVTGYLVDASFNPFLYFRF